MTQLFDHMVFKILGHDVPLVLCKVGFIWWFIKLRKLPIAATDVGYTLGYWTVVSFVIMHACLKIECSIKIFHLATLNHFYLILIFQCCLKSVNTKKLLIIGSCKLLHFLVSTFCFFLKIFIHVIGANSIYLFIC